MRGIGTRAARVRIVTACHYNDLGTCHTFFREKKMQDEKEVRKPLGVRLPDELKQWLKHQAIDNRRSLNAEIVVRLEESRRQEASGAKKK